MINLKDILGDREEVNLYEQCNIVDYRGKTPRKVEKGIQLITAKNIKKGYIDYNISKEYISESDYDEVMSRGKVKKKDILFTTEAPLGNVAMVYDENIALAQRVIKFCGREKLLNEYLMQYFLSNKFKNYLDKVSFGSTVAGISSKELKKHNLYINDIKTQKKIAGFLSSIDILIEKQEGYIESLIEKKEAYVRHFFSHTNNFEYKAFKLKDLFDIQNIGSDKKIKKGEKEVNLLNYMDVYKKKIYTNMKVTIPYDKYDDMTVKKDDLFITPSSETAKDIMNAFVIPEELNNYVYSYHIMRLRAKMDINSKYVEEYLNNKDQRRNFAKLATGAQRYTISKDTIQNYIIYIVSLEEQNKIASLLASMDKLIELNEEKLEQLKLKKKYYLNEIFR